MANFTTEEIKKRIRYQMWFNQNHRNMNPSVAPYDPNVEYPEIPDELRALIFRLGGSPPKDVLQGIEQEVKALQDKMGRFRVVQRTIEELLTYKIRRFTCVLHKGDVEFKYRHGTDDHIVLSSDDAEPIAKAQKVFLPSDTPQLCLIETPDGRYLLVRNSRLQAHWALFDGACRRHYALGKAVVVV